MNVAIHRVFIAVIVLFALLFAFTARWTVFQAADLRNNTLNKLPLLREQQVPRGPIFADRASPVLARSVRRGRGDNRYYERRYPTGRLFAHPIGYASVQYSRSGLERFYDDQLAGRKEEVRTVLDQLLSRQPEGETLVTELNPAAQLAAKNGLAGRLGAVVVIEPSTGRIPVYYSEPQFDPRLLRSVAGYQSLIDDPRSPLFDRVAQSSYPPGSTFKIVTATAAIDSGKFQPTSVVNGDSPKQISGTPLANSGSRSWGDIPLTTALTNSVNTVWAQVGEEIGPRTMFEYMNRYGFNRKPPIDLPADQLVSSGVKRGSKLLGPGDGADIGRVAIGQEQLSVTPLQMASVAATVANGGVRVAPRLARLFTDADGRVVSVVKPDRVQRVMAPSTAAKLTQMMRRVVEEGTGQAASLGSISSAGKTGTAEVRGGNQAWFIGFAPADHPRYAIAVTVQKTTGYGGTVAAPIAKQVFEALLR